jgi:hypothetical protein
MVHQGQRTQERGTDFHGNHSRQTNEQTKLSRQANKTLFSNQCQGLLNFFTPIRRTTKSPPLPPPPPLQPPSPQPMPLVPPTNRAGEPPVVASNVANIAKINLHPPQPRSPQPLPQLPPTHPAVAPPVVALHSVDVAQISLHEVPPILHDYVVETLREV